MANKKLVANFTRQQTKQGPKHPQSTPNQTDEYLLRKIENLLDEGSPQKALELILDSQSRSPMILNATAVCQLRLGNAQKAVDIYRRLLVTGGIFLRPDAPEVYKVNFAVALLMSDNLPGFYSTLAEVDEKEPAAIKVRAGLKVWKQKLSLWQKVLFSCGFQPKVPVEFTFPLGDLA